MMNYHFHDCFYIVSVFSAFQDQIPGPNLHMYIFSYIRSGRTCMYINMHGTNRVQIICIESTYLPMYARGRHMAPQGAEH
jgi:hypothetical protein